MIMSFFTKLLLHIDHIIKCAKYIVFFMTAVLKKALID